MIFMNRNIDTKDTTMPILRTMCTALCSILLACPLLISCQTMQGMHANQENAYTKPVQEEQSFVWQLSDNAEYTYQNILLNIAALRNDVVAGLQAINSMETLSKDTGLRLDIAWYNDASTFLFINEEKELAQSLLHRALQEYPNDTRLTLLYAEASSTLQKYDDALQALQNAYAHDHGNENVRIELIKTYIDSKHFAEAEDLIRSIPAKEQNAVIHYYYAKAALGLQNVKLAEKEFTKAIKMNAGFVEAYAELAYLYEVQKDFAKAEHIYKGLISTEGNNIGLWIRIIDMNMMLDNAKNAYTVAMQGILTLEEKAPDTVMDLMLHSAHTFLDAQYFTQAKDMFKAMMQKEHTPQEAYYFLAAIAYEQDKKCKDALAYLDNVNNTSDYHSRSLQLRAQIEYELGQRKTALETLERAILLYPNTKAYYDMLAQIYINAKSYPKALSYIDNALKNWPKDTEFHIRRGRILDMMGDTEAAALSMEKALEYDPNHAIALNYVAYILAENNQDLQRALDYAQKAVALDSQSGHIMDTLAWVQFKLGRYDEAMVTIKKALDLGADEPEIWEHYGDIALALGKKSLAHKAYSTALTKNPPNQDVLTDKVQQLAK
ncbi:MAG: tetratricopeptide repeat protein [Pseudomonadota bacterium]